MLPSDCISHIQSFLTAKDACNFRLGSKSFSTKVEKSIKTKYLASLVIYRFLRKLLAHKKIIYRFIDRCKDDLVFRNRFIYVHQVHEPHLCLLQVPIWLSKNAFRGSLLRICSRAVGEEMLTRILTEALTEIGN